MGPSEYKTWWEDTDRRVHIIQGDKWIPIGQCTSFTITSPITSRDDEKPFVTLTNRNYEFTMEGIFIPSEGENQPSEDIKLTFDEVFCDD